MTYVEFLRVRKVVTIYAIVIAATVAVSLIGFFVNIHGNVSMADDHSATLRIGEHAHAVVHGTVREAIQQAFVQNHVTIPLSVILYVAFFGATIIASILGCGLCRERDYISQAWTKPVSRTQFALGYLGIDVAGIIVALLIMLVIGAGVTLTVLGIAGYVRVDALVTQVLLLAGGIAFAYYGVVRAISVGFPGRGGVIAGTSWGAFYLLITLASIPLTETLHTMIVVVNFINPLAYLTNFNDASLMSSVIPLDVTVRIVLVWLLAIVTNVAAVAIYNRAEA